MIVLSPDVGRSDVAAGLSAVGGIAGLARAVVSSPAWGTLEAVLVVRDVPHPLMGVVGRLDAVARARVAILQRQLEYMLPRTRLIPYDEVEKAVQRLAEEMIARFGLRACRHFRYRAIPRGGHIVLGLLAYALGLERACLEEPGDASAPLVYVDDCALSGRRFELALIDQPVGAQVILATLFSAPELRAIIERDPRVRACLSACDLRDAAPLRQGTAYEAWQARGRELRDGGFWRGQVEHVCFPWNEPDSAFWNDVTERIERGWRLVPPERCAKHRTIGEFEADGIQLQASGPGPVRLHETVLAASFEDQIVLGSASWPACISLRGSGADMLRALIGRGTVEGAVHELAPRYAVHPTRLQEDLRALVSALESRGAVRSGSSAGSGSAHRTDETPNL